MTPVLRTLAAAAALTLAGGAAHAACDVEKSGWDLTPEEALAVYDCLEADLVAGYQTGAKRWIPEEIVANYRYWAQASTAPQAPGMHSGRFLMTFVNAVGAQQYMEYSEDFPEMPEGSILVKESFSVSDEGGVTPGPLFIMQKAADGTSPETDDWFYMMVSAEGRPQGINVMSACHDCHMGFDYQGSMGYPVPEVRVMNP
ncbi:MAG: cytochrome P460 family protein [Pseudomonadota bacterium]